MTFVSVIVPTYDRPAFLRRAVRSIAGQTHEPIELIVVDDHSPTPVEPVVRETIQGEVLDVTVIRHETNRGAAAARNSGIEVADGEIVAFLDDDDRWTPDVAACYVEAFAEASDEVGLVSVGARNVDDLGATIDTVTPRLYGDALRSVAVGTRIGSFSRFAVKADVIPDVGEIDERLPVWQDLEWHCRLAAHCEFAAVPDLLVERTIGKHDQLTDEYADRRDIAYPIIRDRHRPVFAAQGRWLSRRFMGRLTRGLGSSALASEQYHEAARWFARSIAHDPSRWTSYALLAVSLGGRPSYRTAKRLRRLLRRRRSIGETDVI